MEYRRNLPHIQPEGAAIFVTWRLFGSLPAEVNQKVLISDPTPGRVFVAKDRLLDRASGPRWLSKPEIASFVAQQIRRGDVDRRFYVLHAWTVMPNHVHILMTPDVSVAMIMRWLKGSFQLQRGAIRESGFGADRFGFLAGRVVGPVGSV